MGKIYSISGEFNLHDVSLEPSVIRVNRQQIADDLARGDSGLGFLGPWGL